MTQSQIVFDGESLITPKAISAELSSSNGEYHYEQLATGKTELALILQIARQQFEYGRDASEIIHRLAGSLHETRAKFHPSVWQELIPMAQNHPVSDFFLQDPFTRWSFSKPRGYSGDAQLLDFIYGHPSVEDDIEKATPLGRALYDYTKDASSSVAVRERRDLLTEHVDAVAASRGSDTEILTIAAGHLREANRSVALEERRIKRWVALDQDPISIGSITRDFRGTGVEAINGSVRGLLTNSQKLGQFDFVYAAGLYDYLAENVAVRLTRKCLQMLKPNGVFLFANFATDIVVDGYMETFMNWALLLRSEADMWNIIHSSAERDTFEASVKFGANRNVVYGIIRKRQ